ncbi:MAG: hypothetical protein KBG28_03090 [Kofleriaceae bacterium]|nr:hypothetical protein [Kofleriaceae bacterium]
MGRDGGTPSAVERARAPVTASGLELLDDAALDRAIGAGDPVMIVRGGAGPRRLELAPSSMPGGGLGLLPGGSRLLTVDPTLMGGPMPGVSGGAGNPFAPYLQGGSSWSSGPSMSAAPSPVHGGGGDGPTWIQPSAAGVFHGGFGYNNEPIAGSAVRGTAMLGEVKLEQLDYGGKGQVSALHLGVNGEVADGHTLSLDARGLTAQGQVSLLSASGSAAVVNGEAKYSGPYGTSANVQGAWLTANGNAGLVGQREDGKWSYGPHAEAGAAVWQAQGGLEKSDPSSRWDGAIGIEGSAASIKAGLGLTVVDTDGDGRYEIEGKANGAFGLGAGLMARVEIPVGIEEARYAAIQTGAAIQETAQGTVILAEQGAQAVGEQAQRAGQAISEAATQAGAAIDETVRGTGILIQQGIQGVQDTWNSYFGASSTPAPSPAGPKVAASTASDPSGGDPGGELAAVAASDTTAELGVETGAAGGGYPGADINVAADTDASYAAATDASYAADTEASYAADTSYAGDSSYAAATDTSYAAATDASYAADTEASYAADTEASYAADTEASYADSSYAGDAGYSDGGSSYSDGGSSYSDGGSSYSDGGSSYSDGGSSYAGDTSAAGSYAGDTGSAGSYAGDTSYAGTYAGADYGAGSNYASDYGGGSYVASGSVDGTITYA